MATLLGWVQALSIVLDIGRSTVRWYSGIFENHENLKVHDTLFLERARLLAENPAPAARLRGIIFRASDSQILLPRKVPMLLEMLWRVGGNGGLNFY